MPTVTGSISLLSSMTIISIVLRSMSGIKTTYHRIILGLSSADCLTSLAIALTTIPMPKDVIYPFAMPSYGNIVTCEAQGFIYMMGNGLAFCMNGILNIYYLCTLRYNMTEKTFRCYLEIPLYIVSLAASVVPSAFLIKDNLLNPSPVHPICMRHVYPDDCTKADNPECRGEGGHDKGTYLFTLTLGFLILMITMALVVHSFYRNERKLRKAVKDNHIQEGDEAYKDLQHAQQSSSIIIRQALMYIAAFLITWILGFVQIAFLNEHITDEHTTEHTSDTMFVLKMIFQPLQGFFNLIIFAFHKVYMILQSDEDTTFTEAVGIVFLHPDEMDDSVQLSNLDLVLEGFYGIGGENNIVGMIDGSEVLSSPSNINLDTAGASSGKDSEVDESSVCVHIGQMSSIDEERNKAYKYYGDQNEVGLLPPGAKASSSAANEGNISMDDDLY